MRSDPRQLAPGLDDLEIDAKTVPLPVWRVTIRVALAGQSGDNTFESVEIAASAREALGECERMLARARRGAKGFDVLRCARVQALRPEPGTPPADEPPVRFARIGAEWKEVTEP